MAQPQQTSSSYHLLGKQGNLVIGKNLCITRKPWPFFDTTGSTLIIGDNVQVSAGVYIHTHSHQFDKANWRELPKVKNELPTIICNNVFLGVNAQIMHTCKYIGMNSVVAAGSIVTRDIPDNEIWAGNPAKKIGDVEI